MKLKMSMPKTKMLVEAKNSKSYNVVVEIIIFIGVFFAGGILQAIAIAIPEYSWLFNNPEYLDVVKQFTNGAISQAEMTEKVTAIAMNLPSYLMVISLVATVIATITTMIYCRFFEKRKLSTMGFRKRGAVKEYLVGMLVGIGIFSVAVGICLVTGSLEFAGICANISWAYIGLFFVGFLIQGMSEEVICRGYFMVSLSRRVPVVVAIILSSLTFAALHLANNGITVLAFINLTLFGVFAGVYMLKRGNIWGACAIHSLWNFVQGNFYGISVSGMGDLDTVMKMTSVEGKELINGGSFGLEGGLAVTIVLVIGIVVMLLTKTKTTEVVEDEVIAVIEPVNA